MELKVTAYEVAPDGVATVRFNRPDRGNSWTTRMNAEYRYIMALLDADPAVRVVVLTGTGKQFCVGADFKALDHYSGGDKDYIVSVRAADVAQPGQGVRDESNLELVWHWGLRKPVSAAITSACADIEVTLAGL